jgi:hypothetical protein
MLGRQILRKSTLSVRTAYERGCARLYFPAAPIRHKHNLVTQPPQMALLGVTGSPEGDLMRLIPR